MQKWFIEKWRFILLSILSLATYIWMGYFLDRSNFFHLITCFGILFGAYYLFINRINTLDLKFFIGIGILFRFAFICSIPILSDDYFRFIWDGQLLSNGLNPFDLVPNSVELDFPNKAELLNGMNSPNYFTVYPPIAQMVYWISAKISPNSIMGSVIVIRSILFLAEIVVVILLPRVLALLKINQKNALWYILNPLVIVELCGNLHFEGLVVFFLLLAIYMLALNKSKLASVAWALASATKLIPILLLPIIIRKLAFKKAMSFYILFGMVFLILWLPFYNNSLIEHFLQSIQLYSSSFEFNASIYYLIREIGYSFSGYNIIQTAGPWLSGIAYAGILIILLKRNILDWVSFFSLILFALSWYYILALIIHPWYIIYLVFIGLFTSFRYPMLWSFLAVLSYWAYSNPLQQENYLLLVIEYSFIFGFAIFEFLKKVKLKTNDA